MYEQYFERNYGILTPEEQEKVKNAKVVLIGCGGIGGIIAVALAGPGLSILCFMSTIPTALQYEPPD